MRPSEALAKHRVAVRRVVEVHQAGNARVVGSVARGEVSESSDLDILVDPVPGMTLLDLGTIQHELRQLLGIKVHILTPKGLPEKVRNAMLAEAQPV